MPMKTDDMIEKTKELIAIPSTADNPAALREAVEAIAAMLKDCPGVTIERFEQNGKLSFLAYRGPVRPDTFDILLNAHLDVVSAAPELFKPRVEDGKLYGRGALDMKGTAVVMTTIFKELLNTVPYALGLQIVSDEELGGYDGVRLQIDEGVRSRFVIMGEYANDRNTIYNAARGLCWAEIAFHGKAAHGGHLWHGDNAVVKAGAFAAAVLKHYPTPDKETWTTTASIANLYTPNETYNKVPDTAVVKIDFRFTQEDPVFESRESLEAFIASVDPDAELVNVAVFEPAVKVEELNPFVQSLSRLMERRTGRKTQFLGRPGGSDGRHYALVNNDIIEFGLYGQGSHSDNEYVELASFDEYYKILHEFLQLPLPGVSKRPGMQEPLRMKLLRQLVAIPSVSGDAVPTSQALSFIEQFLAERGMFVEHFESEGFDSLLATTKPSNLKPAVLLTAHVDVVPASKDAFTMKVAGGRIMGRGVMDMKFAIAAYLSLVDALQDNLSAYDFGIMITSDEEIGGRNGANVIVNEKGLRTNVAIVPDSGENWRTETFAKGVQWIKLEADGKPAHASRPWEGVNAINALLSTLHDIRQLIPENANKESTSLSIGTIEGGTAGNQIPASASAMLDIRYGNMEDFEQVHARIHEVCEQHGVVDKLLVSDPPCVNDINNPYLKSFRDLIADVVGAEPGTTLSYGATDGRYFSAVGIPTVIVSPESGERHTESEWLSEKGFEQFEIIIRRYLAKHALDPRHNQKSARNAAKEDKDNPYVWIVNYGSGLSRENFLCQIEGGRPEGCTYTYAGTTDKSKPRKDTFMSLPYELYFAGHCEEWGGGHVNIHTGRDARVNTIARAYLITLHQLEEIAAQQNRWEGRAALPIKEAMERGHATIKDANNRHGHYTELVYVGKKEGRPAFALTAPKPELPYTPPSLTYTKLLFKGLGENSKITLKKAVDYFFSQQGVDGSFVPEQLAEAFTSSDHQKRERPFR
jgi:succinyl-diaminopimelate desuccinylase